MPRLLIALLLGSSLAGCGVVESLVQPEPCWPRDGDFTYEPGTVEGILEADPVAGAMFIRVLYGREVDVGFPIEWTMGFGPGLAGHVDSELGLTILEAGDRVSLWGGLVRADTAPRAPASPGRDGLFVCTINGERVR